MKYSVNDFDILKFFSYTSTIPSNRTIVSFDDFTDYATKHLPNVKAAFTEFYTALEEKACKMASATNEYLMYFHDNKTVFKIRRKSDGKIFYIGRYDWRYAIGTGVYQYSGTQWDFTLNKRVGDYDTRFIDNYSENA